MSDRDENHDLCPECGRDFMAEPQPMIETPDREGVPSGELPGYAHLDDGEMFLRVSIECPDCGWTYEGELKFNKTS